MSHHGVGEEEDGVQNSQEQSGLLVILKQVTLLPPLGAITDTCEAEPSV